MNTLIILKPDAVKRHLVGEILYRFEMRNFTFERMELVQSSLVQVQEHYNHLKNKEDIFKEVCDYMTSGKVLVVELSLGSGEDTIAIVRDMVGATDPAEASHGTIRGDFGTCIEKNVIHASDSLESYEREKGIWFGR